MISLEYSLRFLCCNRSFYNVLVVLKDCCIVILNKRFGKTFILHFVKVISTIES